MNGTALIRIIKPYLQSRGYQYSSITDYDNASSIDIKIQGKDFSIFFHQETKEADSKYLISVCSMGGDNSFDRNNRLPASKIAYYVIKQVEYYLNQ